MVYTILIADDDKNVLEEMSNFFMDKNYNVFTANDGSKALEIMRENFIHMLVTDLMMPPPDGYDLIQLIQGTYSYNLDEQIRIYFDNSTDVYNSFVEQYNATPIILMSKDDMSDVYGPHAFLQKYNSKENPFSCSILEQYLNNLL